MVRSARAKDRRADTDEGDGIIAETRKGVVVRPNGLVDLGTTAEAEWIKPTELRPAGLVGDQGSAGAGRRRLPRAHHGSVLGPRALRFATGSGKDRLVLVNLGEDRDVGGTADPLLAPPEGASWELLFSSEDPRYDGSGTPAHGPGGSMPLPARSALVFAAGGR